MGKTAGGGRYIKGAQLGKGQFGAVYKAYDTELQQWVAVKKIHLGDKEEGVNVTALREIKLLKEIQHEHVVRLIDVFQHKRNVNLVFEFMDTDLEAVIRDRNIVLSPGDIKAYMQMTLKALAYVHNKWVLHRDMKPNNLLISATGILKLADFGLARIFGSPYRPERPYTNQVFARWYRAPELLFGARSYGSAVDMWGVGCVFAELLLRRPFLQGTSDLDQLGKIFAAFGTPQESQWPDVKCLPDYVEFYPSPPQPLRALFPTASDDALDLLGRMFALDPNTRITARQALEHRYFVLGPPPTKAKDLPRPPPPRAEDPIPVPVSIAEPGVKKDAKAAAGQKAPAAAHHQAAAVPSPGTKAARLSYGRAEDGAGRGGKSGDVHSSGHWTEGEHQNLKGGVDGSTLVAMRAIGQADASSARLGAAEDGLAAAGRVSDAHMATGRDSDVSMSGRASDVHMAGGVGETPKDPAARVPLGSAAAPMSVELEGMGGTGQRGSGGHQQLHHQQQHQSQQQQQVQLHQLHPALAPVVLPPRPTISSSERNSLKRKLDLDGT